MELKAYNNCSTIMNSKLDINKIISDITYNVSNELSTTSLLTPSLLAGDFGKIIFLLYASKHGYIDSTIPEKYLTKLLNDLFKQPFGGTYCSGLAGFCIGIDLLEKDNIIDGLSIDLFKHSYKLLTSYINKYISTDFDFLHGVIGIAFYLLRHISMSPEASKLIDYIVDSLYKSSEKFGDYNGLRLLFYNKNRNLCPNLSLAHGLSSIIVFLCRLYKKTSNPVTKQKCHYLIKGYTQYIKSQILDPNEYGSFTLAFPLEMGYSYKSRLAWCYGDIGISLALREIGNVIPDKFYLDLTQKINYYIINNRINPIDNGISDGGLCHGVSGIIQYIKCLKGYHTKDSLIHWHETLSAFFRLHGDRIEFGRYNPQTTTFEHCLNLLEGDSGVGMCLLNENNFLNSILLYEE